jgi:hypothetical protein
MPVSTTISRGHIRFLMNACMRMDVFMYRPIGIYICIYIYIYIAYGLIL